jgi:hypothetical protein
MSGLTLVKTEDVVKSKDVQGSASLAEPTLSVVGRFEYPSYTALEGHDTYIDLHLKVSEESALRFTLFGCSDDLGLCWWQGRG